VSEPALRLREERLEWRAVEGEVVALDVGESAYLAINESGRKLWEALSSGTTRSALVEILTASYERDRADAEREVDAFLAELDRRGLLDQGSGEPT
jgi:hypothetical protein